MKKLILPAALITICTTASSWADEVGCIYDGIKYSKFESVSIVCTEYTQELADAGFSADGYAIVLNCLPVIHIEAIAAGNFSTENIPALHESVWVPDSIHYHHSNPNINHQISSPGTDSTES